MTARELTLVTGAGGKTGLAVIGRLAAAGGAVRAVVLRSRHRKRVEESGAVELLEGDLEDHEAVRRAVSGVAAIYHICPNIHPGEIEIGRGVVAAARAAGVRRFVFHSVLHPQVEAMPHHWAKLRVEEELFESGLEFTILQPAPYMQNVLGQWRAIVEEGVYAVPYDPATRVVMVDLEDVAAAAARVLTEPGHGSATYELCGPGLLDQREIATALGSALGRPVRAEAVRRERWRERAEAAGMGRYQVETLLAMFRYYERFGMAGGHLVLERLLRRPATDFAQFAERLSGIRQQDGDSWRQADRHDST